MVNNGHSPVIEAADSLHDVLYPPDGITLPRYARVERVGEGIANLSRGLIDLAEGGPEITDELIFATGAYSARDAYMDLTKHNMVSQRVADITAANFNEASDYFRRHSTKWNSDSEAIGIMAEFAMLSTIWNGIKDGAFTGYAFMAHSPKRGGMVNGLRDDVDITGNLEGSRQNLQVKLAKNKESYIYADDIAVVSPESIVEKGRVRSLNSLLTISSHDASDRFKFYRNLHSYLKK